MPDRQREINSLAGIETKTAGPSVGADDDSSSNEEDDDKDNPEEKEDQGAKTAGKGDADSSSSDGEGDSEELSDSDQSDDELPIAKKGPGAKKSGQAKPTPKTAKKIQKQVLTKADKQAKNEKLKRDLKKEQ